MSRVVGIAVAAVGAIGLIAALAPGAGQDSSPDAPAEKLTGNDIAVRDCGSRGEPSAEPSLEDLVLGPMRLRLDDFASARRSLFSSRADQVGFRRYIDGARGRALPARKRARLRRLAHFHHEQLKTPVSVAAGHTVTLAIAASDRAHAALFFELGGQQRGRQIGPYYSFRVSDGTPRVRFTACRREQRRFSAPGKVGSYTTFPGALLVAGARCITLEVHERDRPVRSRHVRFGTANCPASAP